MAELRVELDRHLNQQPRRVDFCADAPGACTRIEPDENEEGDQ